MLKSLRWLAAGLVGYLVIALLTTLVLEVWLGGASVLESGPRVFLFATAGVLFSGVIGGVTSGLFARKRALSYAAATLVFLAADTIFITVNQVGDDPAWFKLASGASLMVATLAGGWLLQRYALRGAAATRM